MRNPRRSYPIKRIWSWSCREEKLIRVRNSEKLICWINDNRFANRSNKIGDGGEYDSVGLRLLDHKIVKSR